MAGETMVGEFAWSGDDTPNRICRPGEAEVQHLDRAVLAHLDIGGLEVAMDDTLLVRGFERVGNLPGDGQRLVERDGPARDPLRQVLALDQFHDEGVHVRRPDPAGDAGSSRMP